ncbi:MAG: hypothetical protein WDN06_07765 [Asticcacaulis sp.]
MRRLKARAGFRVLSGKPVHLGGDEVSVISPEFRQRYLSNPDDPEALRGPGHRLRRPRGLPPPHRRTSAWPSDEHCILFMRGAGPIGYRGRPRSSTCAARTT